MLMTGNMPLGWSGEWMAVHIPGFRRMVGLDREGVWFEFILPDDLVENKAPTREESEAFYSGPGVVLYVRQFPGGEHTAEDGDTYLGRVGGVDYFRWEPTNDFRETLRPLPRMDPEQNGYGYVDENGRIDPMGGPAS